MSKLRVLFIYPNVQNELRIPLGISILSRCLRDAGHDTRLYDTTFLTENFDDDYRRREQSGQVKKSNLADYIGQIDRVDLEEELERHVREYDPHLVAVSLIEDNYSQCMRLLRRVKKVTDAPTLLGGIMPTLAAEFVAENDDVDIVCVGDGEDAIVELANALWEGRDYRQIPNLIVKREGELHHNKQRPLKNMDEVPPQDWSIFDLRHLYKAFVGQVYRAGSFEISRGCPFSCSFCVAPGRRDMSRGLGGDGELYRRKSIDRVIQEINLLKGEYGFSFISFCDEIFLTTMTIPRLEEFRDKYRREVGVPFIIQTAVETITEEKVRLLAEAGCVTMSIGIESGSARVRKHVIRKFATESDVARAFAICRDHGVRTTANNIIGLPFETEHDILETVRFNRRVKPASVSVAYFAPYLGTELRKMAIEAGIIGERWDPEINIRRGSIMDMPQISGETLDELFDCFARMFKTPEALWPLIRLKYRLGKALGYVKKPGAIGSLDHQPNWLKADQ